MIVFFPLAVLLAVAYLYRDELGLRASLAYAGLWGASLAICLLFDLSPGIFTALQCGLAVAMLIHVRANPQL